MKANPKPIPPALAQARTLHGRGDLAAAGQSYRQAAAAAPGLAEPWMGLGLVAIQRGNPAQAAEMFQAAVQRDFTSAAALGNLGAAHLALKNYKEAEAALRKAIALDPRLTDAHLNLGVLLATAGATSEALKEFEAVLAIQSGNLSGMLGKGRVLTELGRFGEAEELFRAILKAAPGDLRALCQLVQVLEKQNRLEDAEAVVRELQAKHSGHPHTEILAAIVDYRQKRPEEAVRRLSKVLSVTHRDLSFIQAAKFTLAHALNDLGRYQEAFAAFTAANAMLLEDARLRGINPATYRQEAAHAREIQKQDPAKPGPAARPGEARQPVFFVGFPRSGTTLFERMLDAHPDILVAGEETPLVPLREAMHADDTLPCAKSVSECLNRLSDDQLTALRAKFWEIQERTTGPVGDKLFVDKMPLNIIHLPLAARLFPEARVIVALRDPRDAVLSCYMQHFVTNDVMPNFTKLETAAEVYATVMGMWLEMRDSLCLKWIEFRYEDLIADMEGTVAPILDFIGVGWIDALKSYRDKASKKAVKTPSYTTVGEALNTRAQGRWRHYEAELAPILPVLAPFVEAFGYGDGA